MLSFVKSTAVRNILSFFRHLVQGSKDPKETPSGLSLGTVPGDEAHQVETDDTISHFGEALADADYLVSKNLFREALVIYRKLSSELAGKDEMMKLQFVREKIEMLLCRINQEPTIGEAAQVIEEEKRSAEERYAITLLEADHYFDHELYNESLFLYLKLQKEWASSGDTEKINLIHEKITFLNDVVDDDFKVSIQPIDTTPRRDLTVPDLTRLFGEMISDAEQLIARRQYREALGIYRKLNSDLAGSGELMKIQFVRDKIEKLFERINQEPTAPEAAEIIAQEKESAEERYEATLVEADHYFEHGLYDEALFLYLKLEKEWAGSRDREKISRILEKVKACDGLVQEPTLPEETVGTVYLNEEGRITDAPPDPESLTPSVAGVGGRMLLMLTRQRMVLIVAHLFLVAAGLYCLFQSSYEAMPSSSQGEVYITVPYAGAGVNDVETLVTVPIERAVQGLDHVASITSTSYSDRSSIRVTFAGDSHVTEPYALLKRSITAIRGTLPPACEDPEFLFVDTAQTDPLIEIHLSGGNPGMNRERLAEKLANVLGALPDVREVAISGKSKKEVHVSLSPEKLKAQGLTFFEVTQALKFAGSLGTGGRVADGGGRFLHEGEVLNVKVRKNAEGKEVRIADVVSSATLKQLEPMVLTSLNGLETIRLRVIKKDGANAVDLSRQVKQESGAFLKSHQDGGLSLTYTGDASADSSRSVRAFIWNLVLGLLFMFVAVWIGLGLRNALVALLVIPFPLLATLIVKLYLGIPLYAINLFVFVLVAGILVDNVVVVIENIDRHRKTGKSLERSVIDGLNEIIRPLALFMATLMLAFVPMFLSGGPVGSFFVMMPLPVLFTLAVSLALAMVAVPAYVFEWDAGAASGAEWDASLVDKNSGSMGFFSKLRGVYLRIIDVLIRYKRRTATLVGLVFIAVILIAALSFSGLFPVITVALFPKSEARCQVHVVMPAGTPIKETDRIVKGISTFVRSLDEVKTTQVSGVAGRFTSQDGLILEGRRYGQVIVDLPEKKHSETMMHALQANLDAYMEKTFTDPSSRPKVQIFPEYGGWVPKPFFGIRVTGQNRAQTLEVSDRIMDALKNEDEGRNLAGLTDDRAMIRARSTYSLKPELAHEPGLGDHISQILAGMVKGLSVGKFQTATGDMDLMVTLAGNPDPGSVLNSGPDITRDLADLPMVNRGPAASLLTFGELMTIQKSLEPDFKRRFNGHPAVTISGQIHPQSTLDRDRLETRVASVFENLARDYPGAGFDFIGETQLPHDRFNAFFVGLFVTGVLIYLILGLRFGDFVQPMIVFTVLAFSLIAVTVVQLLTRSPFTVGSLMALVGIALVTVLNTMMMVEAINARIRDGKEMGTAIREACGVRIRPVILTTIALMLWLLPMALGLPFHSAKWAAMAQIFVPGMGISTLLVLLLVPVQYDIVAEIKGLFTGDAL